MPCILWIFIAAWFWATPAFSETHEIKMLSRGTGGSMVFEPDYLKIRQGDTVIFRARHKSHNAASIDGMVPAGFPAFKGRIDEELNIAFDQPGFYGIKCIPHYASGMIMLIKVGEAELSEEYRRHRQPGLARRRFDDIFKRIDAEQ